MPHRRAYRYLMGHRALAASAAIAVAGLALIFLVANGQSNERKKTANLVIQNRMLIQRVERLSASTHGALCAFRGDLKQRYLSAKRILDKHPGEDPVRVFGLRVPRAQLGASLLGQKRTLDSLDALKCQP